jgi:hypothetical protein
VSAPFQQQSTDLVVRTAEGLLLRLTDDPTYQRARFGASLHRQPTRQLRQCGIRTGALLALVCDAAEPPRVHEPKDPTTQMVFVGRTMFNVPVAEAEKVKAWVIEHTGTPA